MNQGMDGPAVHAPALTFGPWTDYKVRSFNLEGQHYHTRTGYSGYASWMTLIVQLCILRMDIERYCLPPCQVHCRYIWWARGHSSAL